MNLTQMVLTVTVFLGATLLFLIEPLIAKMILPWFGGSASVWVTCLLFFQAALLAGYFYAHLLVKNVPPVWQGRLHLMLLAASLLFLPVIPSEGWKPTGSEDPLLHILGLLTFTIGLPFVLLSATGPLLQSWWSSREANSEKIRSVYRLYAVSNFGSLLALLSYPILIEPSLPTRMQAWSWSFLYALYVVLNGAVAWRHGTSARASVSTPVSSGSRPAASTRVLWLCLAAAPSALLLAITNHILRNVAAIPLFWVGPLSLYLLSLILCFENSRWYYRPLWYGLFAAAFGLLLYSLGNAFLLVDYSEQLLLYMGAFFVCCMVCHGELATLKPDPSALTSFYLSVAAGGAIGGLAVAAIAPMVFDRDYDLAWTVLLVALCIYYVTWRRLPDTMPAPTRRRVLFAFLGIWAVLSAGVLWQLLDVDRGGLFMARNFYGPLRVSFGTTAPPARQFVQLRNGNIIHGREFTDPKQWCEPLTYYSRESGIGLAIRQMNANGPVRVGVIGLGAGTIAAYARPRDTFRFYEINPLVRDVAARSFHYLGCAQDVSVALGDARLSLEKEAPQAFDVLAVDAFTSDAIPVHLLTKEAFALYWRHLKSDGILAVHVTNRYIDLEPVVALAAQESGRMARTVYVPIDDSKAINNSYWILISANPGFVTPPIRIVSNPAMTRPGVRAWTDDYSNLWQVLK